MTWEDVTLGDIVTLKRGYDLPTNARQSGPFPVVSSSGITGCHSEPKAPSPGVVTGRYGTLGEVFYIEEPFWPLNTTLYVQDFKGNHPRWVSYMLRTLGFARRSGAAAVPGVNRNALHMLPARRPPLKLQHKIAVMLAAYDELIENNLRRIEILEEMAQTIYREWFVELRFPGHEQSQFVESPHGPLLKGWRSESLTDVTQTQYGFTESTSKEPVGPKFLRGMDFNKRSYIDWSAVPYCPISEGDIEKFRLNPEDVVVVRMADPGKSAIVEEEVDAVFASYLVRITPDQSRLLPRFLFHYLQSPEYQSYISGSSTGTTRKSASAKVLTGSIIRLPPISLQADFTDVVKPIRQLLTILLRTNATLRKTRDLLLHRLISGEIDVSELDVDTSWLAA